MCLYSVLYCMKKKTIQTSNRNVSRLGHYAFFVPRLMHLEMCYHFVFARPAVMWFMVLWLSPFPLLSCMWGRFGFFFFFSEHKNALCFFWREAFTLYFVEHCGHNQLSYMGLNVG